MITSSKRQCKKSGEPNKKRRSGFTLLEMSLVLLIIGLLLLIMLPNLNKQKQLAEARVDTAFVKSMETQATLYQATGKNPTWEELAENGYISPEQKKKATEMGLKIVAGKDVTVSATKQ